MIIAVDVDGPIANLHPVWLADYNARYDDSLWESHITDWNIHKFVKNECGESVYDLLTAEMYDRIYPVQGALEGVIRLRDMGHRVIFVTSGVRKTAGAKWEWLVRHGFLDDKRTDSDYFEAHDKSLINADILIDDGPHNIEAFPRTTIVWDAPYNQDAPGERVINWGEAVLCVKRLNNTATALPELHITERRCPEQVKAFREVIEEMYALHLSKNRDYSPLNLQGTGNIGVVVRAWDKMSRLMSLHGFRLSAIFHGFEGEKEASNESVDDSWIDLANYAVIALLMRRGVWGK